MTVFFRSFFLLCMSIVLGGCLDTPDKVAAFKGSLLGTGILTGLFMILGAWVRHRHIVEVNALNAMIRTYKVLYESSDLLYRNLEQAYDRKLDLIGELYAKIKRLEKDNSELHSKFMSDQIWQQFKNANDLMKRRFQVHSCHDASSGFALYVDVPLEEAREKWEDRDVSFCETSEGLQVWGPDAPLVFSQVPFGKARLRPLGG